MHRIEFHRRARKSLRRIPSDRARQVIGAIEELAHLADPSTHNNVIHMHGEWEGYLRMRVGSYRVIFRIQGEEGDVTLLVDVFDIGPRGGIYG
jgi:mRNA interferase RelE/StbE